MQYCICTQFNIIRYNKSEQQKLLYCVMILQKNTTYSQRPNTINNNNRTFYSFSVTPRKTNYIFKKVKQPQEIQINCLPSFRSVQDHANLSLQSPRQKNVVSLKIQPSAQISCTSFMKSYIEKLKKQRKRQNRKQMISKNHKEQFERANINNKIYLGKEDIYMAKQMNQIFILEKVKEKNRDREDLINTISLVSQNFSSQQDKNNNLIGIHDLKVWKEPSWANKQKIDKLIKQIRESRKKMVNGEQLPQITEVETREQMQQNFHVLPSLTTRCRKRESRTTSKKSKKGSQFNFKTLQPWKQDANINQFSIQQYGSKQSRL